MRFCCRLVLLQIAALSAAPRFIVENSDPELTSIAQRAVATCDQWFPKIVEALHGPTPPPMPQEVRIAFDSRNVPAYAEGNTIHLSPTDAKRPAKLDYLAVVLHELVHIVQRYPVPPRCDGLRIVGCFAAGRGYAPSWLNEGIADYITYSLYTRTNKPFLQIDEGGVLHGYDESLPYLHGLQRAKVPVNAAFPPRGIPAKKGYQHGYTVTASFLLWLVQNKNPQLVTKLNASLLRGAYKPAVWRKECGAGVDRLWDEFLRFSVAQSKAG